jgi:type I restriction enzyme M protein
MSIPTISKRIWNLCHVLRDDGIVYHKYLSELTYLLFLKIAQETQTESLLPNGCRWADLSKHQAVGILGFYRKMLTQLGEDAQEHIIREIFRFPTTVFSHDENLKKVVAGIDTIDWHAAKADGLGNIYEALLERSAAEARAGAGQYFTPRELVESIVRVLKPKSGEIIQDPAAGTGGFLIAAHDYAEKSSDDKSIKRKPPRFQAVEIESDTYRLCLMNTFLHGMAAEVIHGDALTDDAKRLENPDLIIANPPFGTSSGGARPRRADLLKGTSNKQLLFLQHIYSALKPGGRAAVIVPDNVLYEDVAGRKIRTELMAVCNLHTILRLPAGIFYATDVKTSVLFFSKPKKKSATNSAQVWFYDLRDSVARFNRGRVLGADFFGEFETWYGDDPNGTAIRDSSVSQRAKVYSREEISNFGDSLDFRWTRSAEVDPLVKMGELSIDELMRNLVQELQAAALDAQAIATDLLLNSSSESGEEHK